MHAWYKHRCMRVHGSLLRNCPKGTWTKDGDVQTCTQEVDEAQEKMATEQPSPTLVTHW